MFDLEKQIAAWREELIRAGVKNPEVLDELENHLREDVAQRVQAGAAMEDAFANAVEQIGRAKTLEKEFMKIGKSHSEWLKKFKHGLAVFLGLRTAAPGSHIVIPAPEHFSLNARESLDHARTQAMGLHHDFIGTEHVLLGLFQEENSIVKGVLNRMGAGQEKIRHEIEKWVPMGPQCRPTGEIPYTPRARQALALAESEAKAQHRADI